MKIFRKGIEVIKNGNCGIQKMYNNRNKKLADGLSSGVGMIEGKSGKSEDRLIEFTQS